MTSRSRIGGPVAVVCAVVLIAALARSSHTRPDTAVVVSAAATSPAIPAGFVGFSFEYPAVSAYAGATPALANPTLARLIEGVAPGQSPVIRIGGDSSDTTWWPVRGIRRPPGVTFGLTPGWAAVVRRLAMATRARLILGIDLEAGVPALAAAEARLLEARVGRRWIEAFEIGNEAARYRMFPWYHTRAGLPVFARAAVYGPRSFIRQFRTFASRLPGAVPLAGPTFAGPDWMRYLGRFLVLAPHLGLVTYHRYPLDRCGTAPTSPRYPTIPRLLSLSSSRGLTAGLAGYVALARARGLALRVDELNSVACGGRRGVSDVFASALWALDTLFAIARSGAVGANFHAFPQAAYSAFSARRRGRRWSVALRPEYYGLELFARAAPPGSRLLSASSSDLASVRAWATRTTDGTVRILLVNDDVAHSHLIAIRQPLRGRPAMVVRLTAPSPAAKRGISLSDAGRVGPRPNGTYQLALPAASAALLTVRP